MRYKIDLLALPSSYRNSINEKVPQPKHDLPEYCPPCWNIVPLQQKVPIIQSPQNENLYRKKIGEQLFRRDGADFDLDDPYMYNISYQYEALHDPALKKHFQHPALMRKLRDHHAIGEQGEVYCTLKDYNDFRRFLSTRHLDNVKRVRVSVDEKSNDIRAVKNAVYRSDIYNSHTNRRERFENARKCRKEDQLAIQQRRLDYYRKTEKQCILAEINANEIIQNRKIQLYNAMVKRNTSNALRKIKIKEHEMGRNALLRRKINIKYKLSKEHRRAAHLNSFNEKLLRETSRRNRHFEWRTENQRLIQTLIALNEEEKDLRMKIRKKKIEQSQERFEEELLEKKANQLRKTFGKVTIDNLIKLTMKEIQKLFGDEYLLKKSKIHPGLDDTPTIYERLNKDVVNKAIRTMYDNVLFLKVPLSTSKIIGKCVDILRRYAAGYSTNELPQDPIVWNFIREKVLSMMAEIREMVARRTHSKRKTSLPKTDMVRKISVNFDANMLSDIPPLESESPGAHSATDEFVRFKSIQERPPSPHFSHAKMIRRELETIGDSEKIKPPEEMNTKAMIHFHDFQKFAVGKNLQWFRYYLELLCCKYKALRQKPTAFTENDKAKFIDLAVKSMLTFPEENPDFGNCVLKIGQIILSEVSS